MSALSTALAGFGKKKKQNEANTVVLEGLRLFSPTDTEFPIFDIPALIKEQTGKACAEENPLGDNEEFRKLESIAQKFEEKYGPKRDKKGRKIKFGKPEDYMDLGMGYDQNDPFIDDTAAYDELVPSTLTPIHGGFYVNKGPLEFRDVSDSDDDDEEGDKGPKAKVYRPVPDDESSSSSDSSDTASNKSTNSTKILKEAVGSSTISKNGASNKVQRRDNETTIRKVGRPCLTPKQKALKSVQKASAVLLKSAKGRARKNNSANGETLKKNHSMEKSDSFMHRLVDTVNSVASSGKNSDSNHGINVETMITDILNKANSAKQQKLNESSTNLVSPKMDTTGGSIPKTPLTNKIASSTESKEMKPPKLPSSGSTSDSDGITVVDISSSSPPPPPPQRSFLRGRPPTSAQKQLSVSFSTSTGKANEIKQASISLSPGKINEIKTTSSPHQEKSNEQKSVAIGKANEVKVDFQIPPLFLELNNLLVQRAKEGGQLSFNTKTDLVLHKIMDECGALNYKEAQIDAVFYDLSSRLRVDKNRVVQRWNKIKDLRSPRKSAATTTSSSTSTTSFTSKLATSMTSISQQQQPVKKSVESNLGSVSLPTLLELLRKEIEKEMPTLESDHRKLAEEVAIKKLELIQTGTASEGEKMKNVYTPRRKYSWNDKSKKLLNVIINKIWKVVAADNAVKNKQEALKVYLESHVVNLWPQGWMNYRELIKESRDLHGRIIRPKEGSQTAADTTNSSVVSTMTNVQSLPTKSNISPTIQSTSRMSTSVLSAPISSSTPTAVKVGESRFQNQMKPKFTGTQMISPPPRLGFSIQNLTSSSSSMGTTANSSMASQSNTSSNIGHHLSTGNTSLDDAQKQRIQMELALMMAAAGQGHPNSSNLSSWFSQPRQ